MKERYDEVFNESHFTDFVNRLIELRQDGITNYEIHIGKGVDKEDVAIVTYYIEIDE